MWVKIDDGFATHPKILKGGVTALAIQIRAICYASQNQTDGFLPVEAMPIILFGTDGNDWPTNMVNLRLWDEVNGGYAVHNFLKWNVSKKDQEVWKKKLSVSGKKGMKSRWNKKKSNITPVISKVITPVITDTITSLSTSTSTSTSTSDSSSLNSLDLGFEQFWKAYPRKVGKAASRKAWQKARDKPEVSRLIEAIEKAKGSTQWQKDAGQYIPHPARWLNEGRWEDANEQQNGSAGDRYSGFNQKDYRANTW